MTLIKYKLGTLIEICDERNTLNKFTLNSIKGISTEKIFINTKANLNGVNLNSYKIVKKNEFAYVPDTSRRGEKIAIAFNTKKEILVSSIYTVFKIKRSDLLLPNFLFIYFNRPEFDRYSRFNSWGSARETFNWEDMCNIEINLPPLSIQQKYVNIYNAMITNQQCYENKLNDLEFSLELLIDKYKHTQIKKSMGSIFKEIDSRNKNNTINNVQGINISKQFMKTIANTNKVDLKKYKLVQKHQFAFSGMQTGRDECIRIALYDGNKPIIISPAYTVFENNDSSVLTEYIMIWFLRKEVDRLGWFLSDSSIRTNLDLDRFLEMKIPVPELKIQESMVKLYSIYIKRKNLNEKLKKQIKNICPILIKGAINEAKSLKDV